MVFIIWESVNKILKIRKMKKSVNKLIDHCNNTFQDSLFTCFSDCYPTGHVELPPPMPLLPETVHKTHAGHAPTFWSKKFPHQVHPPLRRHPVAPGGTTTARRGGHGPATIVHSQAEEAGKEKIKN